MAFAIKGANAELSDLFPGVGARGLAPGGSPYPVLQPRQNGSAPENTVNMFVDSVGEDWSWAASVVEACADQTVMALQCTSAGSVSFVGQETCGPSANVITVTVASTTWHLSQAVTTTTLGYKVSATAIENCVLAGTTAATCTATAGGTADGTSTTTSTTMTLSGTDYFRFDVAITGGAEKTAAPAATCSSKSKSAGAVVSSKSAMVWALAGVATGLLTLL